MRRIIETAAVMLALCLIIGGVWAAAFIAVTFLVEYLARHW